MALFRAVHAVVARRRSADDAIDIASEVVAVFLVDPERIMAAYPDAEAYARAAVRHATIDFDRRQRAQRGQGARLRALPDGEVTVRRSVVSGDAPGLDGAPTPFDSLADQRAAAVDDQVSAWLDSQGTLAALLEGESPDDRRALFLVDGLGYTVHEVAALGGVRRETMSRRLNAVRRRVRARRHLLVGAA